MHRTQVQKIDDTTLSLLKAVFGANIDSINLPIDLNRIAQYYRLTIKQGTFTTEPDTEGILSRNDRTIFLSEDDPIDRKNFTLAHEIGHFKLHQGKGVDIFRMHQLDDLLTREGEDQEEDEADLFAASLLMPRDVIKSLWKANQDTFLLAKIFGVPENAVTFRLRNLGLIKK